MGVHMVDDLAQPVAWQAKKQVHLFHKPITEDALAICGAKRAPGPLMLDLMKREAIVLYDTCNECRMACPEKAGLPELESNYTALVCATI